jgi:hypothetical protein
MVEPMTPDPDFEKKLDEILRLRKELEPEELFRRVAKKDETLDEEWVETAYDLVREEGRLVAQHHWDSGGPGAGADTVDIYLFRGLFIGDDDTGCFGPFESFADAAKAMGLFVKTKATTRIWVAPEFEQT